ncbi:MAG: fibronectin type III domain-containing protein, partial [Opitutaceae bacterium]|nr:fibronectin type III domain-containing protein [Verrucomicrobiales bacterium]
TDVPGFPGAIPALVNDLDLEVEGPDGTIYRGNQFEAGESGPDAPSSDSLNNVEGVHLQSPLPGEYKVRVRARNVVSDARKDTPAIDQDFALVISADIPLPGVGIVFFDRRAYRAPDLMKLRLIDFDLAGQASVSVQLRSSTEPGGETINLLASGPFGVFTGTVSTATGAAVPDGKLQVANGNWIEIRYLDVSAGIYRTNSAVADLSPPILNAINSTTRFGKTAVSWTANEPVTAIVYYGTSPSLINLSVTNRVLTSTPQGILQNLVPGLTYYYYVVSSDEAGNVTTNNNFGTLYSFVAQPAATVLLVNAYELAYPPPDPFDPDPDPNPSSDIPLSAYTNALNQIGVSYDVWNVETEDMPTFNDLVPFRVVIWRLNDDFNATGDRSTLTTPVQSAITNFLAQGGSFFLSSMEILSRLGNVPFTKNALQVGSFATNPEPFLPCDDCDEDRGVAAIEGAEGDLITQGILTTLDYSAYPFVDLSDLGLDIIAGPDLGDTFVPTVDGVPILFEVAGNVAGVRYPRTGQDGGRLVFMSFPLDAIPATGSSPNNRAEVLRRVLQFLVPGLSGVGTISLDSPKYSVPNQITVEVGDLDLAGLGQTAVSFRSTLEPAGQTLILQETPRRGLFRGYITLISPTNSPVDGALRAQEGDLVWVDYFDASGGSTVRAEALVDTTPPVISNIEVLAQFQEATFTWETSEFTDATVQFGESDFLNRTAYDLEFGDLHEARAVGLIPDKLYYYRLVSRDIAGNVTTVPSDGSLLTFRTLKATTPPWYDDLESTSASTNWSTLNGELTESTWELGVPANSLASAAYSPVNAWGTNLRGDYISGGDTTLLSPVIQLVGGTQARLRFWHNYNFIPVGEIDLIEVGDLYITTNNGGSQILLAEFGEASAGWELQEIDLTPYLGQTVRFSWVYAMSSFEFGEHPGWLIDDISVVISGLSVSNNLAQASFTLFGPGTNYMGRGLSFNATNPPPGEYRIQYNPVEYYQAPVNQTNTFSDTNSILFLGNYTFVDGNNNGIADAWEQAFFGGVAPGPLPGADEDGDGMSDFAEFMAGTNPTNQLSTLSLSATLGSGGFVQFDWPSGSGRDYRVLGSSNLVNWTPSSSWITATSQNSQVILPPNNGPARFFKLEVRP